MRRKLLLTAVITAVLVFALTLCIAASTIYKDENGSELFRYEKGSGNRITSYTGEFPKTDGEGNALIWYVESSQTVGSDTVYTVKSFKALGDEGSVYGSLDENGNYSVTGVSGTKLVSFNLPDDSGIKIINVDFGGGYTGTFPRDSSILFAYLPNTLEEYSGNGGGGWKVQRLFQYTPLIECYFSDLDTSNPNHMKTIGNFDFYGCRNMTKCILPNGITTIFGDSNFNNGPAFRECYSLTELVIPNTVTSIGAKAFENCTGLEVIRLGEKGNISNGGGLFTSGLNSLKYVYLSNAFSKRFDYLFSSARKDVVYFYTGTYEDYQALVSTLTDTGNGLFKNATAVQWDSKNSDGYYGDLAESAGKSYVVYGYSPCEAFRNGEHEGIGELSMQFNGYLEKITFVNACSVEGCSKMAVDESKTLDAMFTYRGYSRSMYADADGKYSMVQAYTVNKQSIEEYVKATGNEFAFGVVATGNQGGEAIVPDFDALNVQSKLLDKLEHNYFEIKVCGITQALFDTSIVFCAYISDGGKTVFIEGSAVMDGETVVGYEGKEKESVTGVSYGAICG